ncbi:MAG: class I SAM-dependent methyltransferase [Candidatus Thorarchaeota archaeon]|nr:class I SAM-dependent methyltransferase [Candidatus Thorarchaeota archaeon]
MRFYLSSSVCFPVCTQFISRSCWMRIMTVFYGKLAKYYDLIYDLKDYKAEADKIHQIVQEYKTSQGNALLDTACGTGSHLIHLKERYNITGLDVSKEMIEIARARLPGIELIHESMTTMNLGKKFDVITCLFGSITYLTTIEELSHAINAFSKHLVPGGVVLIEPLFTKETVHHGSTGISCVDRPEVKLARVNTSTIEGDIAYLNFHFLLATEKGVEHFVDPSPMGIFSRATFMSLMKGNGLTPRLLEPCLSRESLFLGVQN